MTSGYLKEIYKERPRDVRLMGLDIGKKTIGVALCDPTHSLATPLQTIKRTKFTKDIRVLEGIIREYEVGGFVLGLPINNDESEGRAVRLCAILPPRCAIIQIFSEVIRGLPFRMSGFPHWLRIVLSMAL